MAKRSGDPEVRARGNPLPRARIVLAATAATLALLLATGGSVHADGNLHNVNHIIIVMQENHSFDKYFGVLPYASGTPYHGGGGKCTSNDHTCVDGLSCTRGRATTPAPTRTWTTTPAPLSPSTTPGTAPGRTSSTTRRPR